VIAGEPNAFRALRHGRITCWRMRSLIASSGQVLHRRCQQAERTRRRPLPRHAGLLAYSVRQRRLRRGRGSARNHHRSGRARLSRPHRLRQPLQFRNRHAGLRQPARRPPCSMWIPRNSRAFDDESTSRPRSRALRRSARRATSDGPPLPARASCAAIDHFRAADAQLQSLLLSQDSASKTCPQPRSPRRMRCCKIRGEREDDHTTGLILSQIAQTRPRSPRSPAPSCAASAARTTPTKPRSTPCAARFRTAPFAGKVVIGEGEIDEAPMLYIGEELGAGGIEVDIAVDPLEGTKLCAQRCAERDDRRGAGT
jgi:hypothetical protein